MLLVTADTESDSEKIIFSYVLTDLERKKDEKGTIEVNYEKIDKLPRITEKELNNLGAKNYQEINILGPDDIETIFILFHNPQDSIGHVGVFVLIEEQTKLLSKKKENQSWIFALSFLIFAFILWGTYPMIGLVGKQITFWIMSILLVSTVILFTLVCCRTK